MNAAEVRALYGRAANRTAMLDAIVALDVPSGAAGILYIPTEIVATDERSSDELVAELIEAMTKDLRPGVAMPEIRWMTGGVIPEHGRIEDP